MYAARTGFCKNPAVSELKYSDPGCPGASTDALIGSKYTINYYLSIERRTLLPEFNHTRPGGEETRDGKIKRKPDMGKKELKLFARRQLFLHDHNTIDNEGAAGIGIDIVHFLGAPGSFIYVPHGKGFVSAGIFDQA